MLRKRIIAELENLSAKLIETETKTDCRRPWPKRLRRRKSSLGHDIANRTLLILDDLPYDIGSALFDRLLDRTDVIVSAGDPADPELHYRVHDRLEYGSLLNLSRASSSVDAVVWVSGEIGSRCCPVRSPRDLSSSETWRPTRFCGGGRIGRLGPASGAFGGRIGFDENEIASAPIYSCFLRKKWSADGGCSVAFRLGAFRKKS